MTTVRTDTIVYAMSRDNAPAAHVKSGDTLRFETLDCFGGQIAADTDKLGALDWERINPATGPVYVEGAEPGDVLKVEILAIDLADHGTMLDLPGEGITGCDLTEEAVRILPVEGDQVRFNEKLAFPLEPMIGVIGVAPASGACPCGTPGPHGGNMDCTQIAPGATLYLPVNVPGALLAMGDLHARMGDGEVSVCGVEIAGTVTVHVTALKDCGLPTPFLVNSRVCMAICSAPTADEAGAGATMAMRRFLMETLGMDVHEAGMLLSVAGQLRVCQVVDPEKTFRMELPLSVAEAYGCRFA